MLKYILLIASLFLTSCDITTPGFITINFEASSLTITPSIDIEEDADPLLTGGPNNKVYRHSNYSVDYTSNEIDPGEYTFEATIQFSETWDCTPQDTTVSYHLDVESDQEYAITVYPSGCTLSVSGFDHNH